MLKLTAALNCILTFTSYDCIIQGNPTLMRIGATNLHHDLYILTLPTHINNCTLWHNRLKHPSNEVLLQINKKFPLTNFSKNYLPCDVFLC